MLQLAGVLITVSTRSTSPALSTDFSQFCLTRCLILEPPVPRHIGQFADDLALEVAVQLASDEVHDLARAEARRTVAEQTGATSASRR